MTGSSGSKPHRSKSRPDKHDGSEAEGQDGPTQQIKTLQGPASLSIWTNAKYLTPSEQIWKSHGKQKHYKTPQNFTQSELCPVLPESLTM